MSALSFRPLGRLGLAPVGGRRFAPDQLPDLAFWYDAGKSAVVETGGAVERWDDLSGNANHAGQAASGRRPARATDAEGRDVIRFDGIDDALEVETPPDLGAGVTVFVVFRMRTRVDFSGIVSASAAGATDHEQFFTVQNETAASQRFQVFGKSAETDPVVVRTPDSTETQYAIVTIGASSAALHDLNGEENDVSTAAALGTPDVLVLGARHTSGGGVSNSSAVDLYEVGLYPRVLAAGEIARLERYLRARRDLAWNPMHIGGDLRWFHDALDGPFTLDGSAVDQWDDRSGAARHWVQSGAARPARTTDADGRSVVRFDGTDDNMAMAGTLPPLEPFSVAVVYRMRERTDFEGVLSAAPASGADHTEFWTFQMETAASGDVQVFGRSTETDFLLLRRPDTGVAQLAIWTTGSGSGSFRDLAGTISDTYDGGFGTPDQVVLGGRYNDGPFGFAAVDVFATVGVARVLDPGDQQKLIDWAVLRWGLS